MTDIKSNIYQRILAVTADVKSFGKDSQNTQFNFKYASVEQVVAVISPVCVQHGIVLLFEADILPPATNINKNGQIQLAMVMGKLTAVNVDEPSDRIVVSLPAAGFDTLDKGIYKALSGARKYAIFSMFNLMTGSDDPETNVDIS
jgi:hypothetical protein